MNFLMYKHFKEHIRQGKENSKDIIARFDICKSCHCQTCFHKHVENVEQGPPQHNMRERSKSEAAARGSNKSATPPNTSIQSRYPDSWFTDMARFRRKHYWDCHADTLKF